LEKNGVDFRKKRSIFSSSAEEKLLLRREKIFPVRCNKSLRGLRKTLSDSPLKGET
jgi:hypothetical protein